MRLVMDAVSAIEWNGDNLDAIRTFVAPLTLVVKDDDLLLLLDSANRVYKIRLKDWLTRPENLKGTMAMDVNDTRGDDGFSSQALCILCFSQVKAEFRIELDTTDDETCEMCNKPLYEHTVLVGNFLNEGRDLEFACPPDPANEIDREFTEIEATEDNTKDEKKIVAEEFKRQVFARVAPQAPEESSLAEFDASISVIFDAQNCGAEVNENRVEEEVAFVLDAQNSWRK